MKNDVVISVETGTVRWFSHVEGMDISKIAIQICEAIVDVNVRKGRPWRTFLNQKVSLNRPWLKVRNITGRV